MKTRYVLFLCALATACLLTYPQSAAAYIKAPPPTLGSMCNQPDHICVLRVEEVNAEKGVILFKHVEQLKGKYDDSIAKHVIKPNVKGAKTILDGAVKGKTAVVFYFNGGNDRADVYIDSYWYWVGGVNLNPGDKKARPDIWWFAQQGEPALLSIYSGTADKLRDAVAKILKGEEVVVPAMVGDNKELEQRQGKVQNVRASLKLLGDQKPNTADKKPGDKKPGDTKPDDKKPGDKKPGDAKPGDKKPDAANKPDLVGIVKKVAEGGKSFTLLIPMKVGEPTVRNIQINDLTKIVLDKESGKLAPGLTVSVWLKKGEEGVAAAVQIGKPGDKPVKKPDPNSKPNGDKKPVRVRTKAPARPARDHAPIVSAIDTEIDRHLASEKIPASPQADDSEFLRRVTLDLTGRIPTYQQTVAFLESKDRDKRRKLIDELLNSDDFGEHFATIYNIVLAGRDGVIGVKQRNEGLRPWLADQFNDNRGWDAIVKDLLTAEGTPQENPAITFLMVNSENGQPQPNKVANAVSRIFLGVNVGCAECHNHPFAAWKQSDFWGMAAFFGKTRYGGTDKSGPQSLTESSGEATTSGKKFGQNAFAMRGTAIVIPDSSGKAAGQAIKARFLGGAEATLDEKGPFRPTFAAWVTGKDNPYFARAAANRIWAHFLGRGFVNPLDTFDENNPPSHPALLKTLAEEFAASGFDMKHLARCITMSKAYQRSSRPVQGNGDDSVAFSHAAVKVLTPEVFFDSVTVIMKSSTEKQESRDLFVRSFHAQDSATEYTQGIPQMLRLMNGTFLNRGSAVVDRLVSSGASHTEAITTLYLTVLSRRPTADEVKLLTGYLSRRKSERDGYRGVMWILLNSSEFALNH